MAVKHVDVVENSFAAWYDEIPTPGYHLIPFFVTGIVITDYRVLSVELKPARQPGSIGTTLNLQIVAKLSPEPPPGQPHPEILINHRLRYDEHDREAHWTDVDVEHDGKTFRVKVISAQ